MKKIYNHLHFIISTIILFSACDLFAQNYPIGIYVNVLDKSQKISFYTTNGIHYIKQDSSKGEIDDKNQKAYTYGMRRSGMDLNYTSGPFATYGQDGYFYRNNGKDFYFDKLLSEYEGVYNNPKDSLRFLYVKESNLPLNWELTPEARIGELGVVNNKTLYEIIKVVDIYKSKATGSIDCVYIKGYKNSEEEVGTYLIAESDYFKLNISKIGYSDISQLKGKLLQLFFKWEAGYLPGLISEDEADLAGNKNSMPFEIQLLDKSINAKSLLQYPVPRN